MRPLILVCLLLGARPRHAHKPGSRTRLSADDHPPEPPQRANAEASEVGRTQERFERQTVVVSGDFSSRSNAQDSDVCEATLVSSMMCSLPRPCTMRCVRSHFSKSLATWRKRLVKSSHANSPKSAVGLPRYISWAHMSWEIQEGRLILLYRG